MFGGTHYTADQWMHNTPDALSGLGATAEVQEGQSCLDLTYVWFVKHQKRNISDCKMSWKRSEWTRIFR
jgi:hypothetical protein